MNIQEHKVRINKIKQYLPKNLYGHKNNTLFPWKISPEPFLLDGSTVIYLEHLGQYLFKFYQTINSLFYHSIEKKQYEFIAKYLEQGKPDFIIECGRRVANKKNLPSIIRPDLLFTDHGIIACELDSVPGGFGTLAALNQCYAKLGDKVIGGKTGILEQFSITMKELTGKAFPHVVIAVSDESNDYLSEMKWLARTLNDNGYLHTTTVNPRALNYECEQVSLNVQDRKFLTVDAIYRFFELFDLPNISNSEQLLSAVHCKHVKMTPPPKAHLEEKLWFALFHHPKLINDWHDSLGEDAFHCLKKLIPKTWIIDPSPVPSHAVIADLITELGPIQAWHELIDFSKSQRKYVVKPSGFSPLAWGGHGVTIADNVSKEKWKYCINNAINSFSKTPYILQDYHKASVVNFPYWDELTDEIKFMQGRARISPYYFINTSGVKLAGALATIVPVEKPIIHGMSEAIFTPCAIDLKL